MVKLLIQCHTVEEKVSEITAGGVPGVATWLKTNANSYVAARKRTIVIIFSVLVDGSRNFLIHLLWSTSILLEAEGLRNTIHS